MEFQLFDLLRNQCHCHYQSLTIIPMYHSIIMSKHYFVSVIACIAPIQV